MIKKLFLIIFAMGIGAAFSWKAMDARDANGNFVKQNILTHFMVLSQNMAKNIKSGAVGEQLKNAKFKFAGKEISLNLSNRTLWEYIKTEPRAQRALFVYFLFLLNVWIVPLFASAKQRRLKQELFDLHPALVVDNLKETRDTPRYTTSFMSRTFYMSYPGSFFLLLAFVSPLFAVMLVGGLVGYAMLSYHIRIKKYESVANFQEAINQGSGATYALKQIVSLFVPQTEKNAFDKAYKEALVKAQKKNAERKVG